MSVRRSPRPRPRIRRRRTRKRTSRWLTRRTSQRTRATPPLATDSPAPRRLSTLMSQGGGGGGHVVAKDAVGRYGENVAALHLVEAGLEVLDRNWRCAAGEIDIVAREGDVVVICEVKTRSSTTFGAPQEAITPVKAARLRQL